MMAIPGEELFPAIMSSLLREHDVVGAKIASDVKDRISVPVGYKIGPRGGSTKIRSKKGEPPRKDTGRLKQSITSESITDTDEINTSVFTEVEYAKHLEEDLDRPIFESELEAVEQLILDHCVDAVENE